VETGSRGGSAGLLDLDLDLRGLCQRELNPLQDQVVSASYDKILRSWDVEAGRQLRTFSGHGQSTLAVAFDPTGNVIASG
jgi:WD40 repeat protein